MSGQGESSSPLDRCARKSSAWPPLQIIMMKTYSFVQMFWGKDFSGVNKAPGSESAARICPRKSPPKRGLWESYFLLGIIGKTHTQNLRILREDTLGATCSAGPFCLLLNFVEKSQWNIFKRQERGFANFGDASDFFSDPFSCFSCELSCWVKHFRGQFRSADVLL